MNTDGVLILSRAEIARLMAYSDYVDALEATYRAAAEGRVAAPPAMGVPVTTGSFHAKGAAVLGDESKVAIKINGNFPNNAATHGLPTIQGIIYLADGSNGRPMAVMDSIEVTINRTAAATTLAARYLARPDSKIATICGVGVQGRIQLKAIAAAVKLERIFVWDIDHDRAAAFAREMSAALALDVQSSIDLACARQSDIIVACTSAKRAFLTSDLVRPGTFIAAVGADNSDKSEIAPKLYARCLVVVDSPEQAAAIGDLHHAIAAGAVSPSHVHASLGELIAGTKQGRTDADTITLFDSTGMGLQDLSAAVAVYRRAIESGAGTRVSLA
jgi:alanine dehydrogenase